MWVFWWIGFIIVTGGMVSCILYLNTSLIKESKAFKFALLSTIGLFIGMLILAAFLHHYQPPWEGTGKIISKEYTPETVKREFNGKFYVNRTYPECYAVYIVPNDAETAKIKFTAACINKEAWEKTEIGQSIVIDRSKQK